MPDISFFRRLGLFAERGFLSSEFCSRLVLEMRFAPASEATISRGAQFGLLDRSSRRVSRASVNESSAMFVQRELYNLKPKIERHFWIALTGCETAEFLKYQTGDFFRPHRDANDDSASTIRNRKVSAVIFLNCRSNEPATGCYGGGALSFYGLLDGKQWERLAFSLEPEPGMIIAFRSDTIHEVQPVTFGERLTAVSWFSGRDPST